MRGQLLSGLAQKRASIQSDQESYGIKLGQPLKKATKGLILEAPMLFSVKNAYMHACK